MTLVEWDRATLSNLDSSLNAWVDSVPDHCKFLLNPFELCYNRLRVSAMGPPLERRFLRPVCHALCHILLHPNPRSSTVHHCPEPACFGVFLVGDLYQCSEGVYSHHGDPIEEGPRSKPSDAGKKSMLPIFETEADVCFPLGCRWRCLCQA